MGRLPCIDLALNYRSIYSRVPLTITVPSFSGFPFDALFNSVQVRGRLVTVNNAFLTGGQFIASVVDGAFINIFDGWRYMLGVAAIPAIFQFVAFLFLPESPRWLVGKGE